MNVGCARKGSNLGLNWGSGIFPASHEKVRTEFACDFLGDPQRCRMPLRWQWTPRFKIEETECRNGGTYICQRVSCLA